MRNKKWTEFGCGVGYYLSALKDFGVKNFIGIDADENMAKFSQQKLGEDRAKFFKAKPEEIIRQYPADIYVGFFVFEHFDNLFNFIEGLKKLPSGTIIIFSVPIFGLTSLLENIFLENYARNLNGIIHTQIFTDKSINYAVNASGFEMVAQWIFGQDANDLVRILINHTKHNLPESIREEVIDKLITLNDSVQQAIDKSHFSDQRHFIIKKI